MLLKSCNKNHFNNACKNANKNIHRGNPENPAKFLEFIRFFKLPRDRLPAKLDLLTSFTSIPKPNNKICPKCRSIKHIHKMAPHILQHLPTFPNKASGPSKVRACRARFWLCSTPKACSCKALATASTAPSPPKLSVDVCMPAWVKKWLCTILCTNLRNQQRRLFYFDLLDVFRYLQQSLLRVFQDQSRNKPSNRKDLLQGGNHMISWAPEKSFFSNYNLFVTKQSKSISVNLKPIHYFECFFFRVFVRPFCFTLPNKKKQEIIPKPRFK